MSDICRQSGSVGAVLFSGDVHFQGFPTTPSLSERIDSYVKDGWSLRDERRRGMPTLLAKGIISDEDCNSREAINRSAFYQEFLRPNDFGSFIGVGFKAGQDVWLLSLNRRVGQAPFDEEERAAILRLWRPLSDAATLSRQMGFARALGVTDAHQGLRQPAVVLDGARRVLALNDGAQAKVGDWIDVGGRSLRFYDPISQSKFDALLASALRDELAADPRPMAQIVRSRQLQPLAIRAIALRGWAQYSFANAAVLLLLGEPQTHNEDLASILMNSFGLTKAEARIAIEIGAGGSVAAAADKFGVTYETARAQLRAVFGKTDTHRQGQLAALIGRLPGS